MPTTVISSENRPTYVEKPDIRYGTTFLSTEYRDYSVNGEAIMDKTTGELFLRRPKDGKVISFDQNKKYLHDLVLELRVLLTNNVEFYYPKDSVSGYYVCTNYDLVTVNNEAHLDIKTGDTIIDNANESSLHHLSFNISNLSNGFFCRATTRDSDKAIVEYYTNQYNKLVESYIGDNADIKAEQEKMNTIGLWKDSNVVLNYTVTIKDASQEKSYTQDAYIRFNEEVCVLLPMTLIDQDFEFGYNSCHIQINSLSYPKIHFAMEHKAFMDGDFEDNEEKLLAPDGKIYVNFLNVMSFVNDAGSIEILGNESIIALLDIPFVIRYMSKMAKLMAASSWIQCTNRPDDEIWTTNTVWAEHVSDIYKDGEVIQRGSETDILRMEQYFSKAADAYHSVILVQDPDAEKDFYLDTNYTINEDGELV